MCKLTKSLMKNPNFFRVKNNLAKDQHKAREPDYKTPFKTVKDALCALAPYHVYQTKDDPADRVAMGEAYRVPTDVKNSTFLIFFQCSSFNVGNSG